MLNEHESSRRPSRHKDVGPASPVVPDKVGGAVDGSEGVWQPLSQEGVQFLDSEGGERLVPPCSIHHALQLLKVGRSFAHPLRSSNDEEEQGRRTQLADQVGHEHAEAGDRPVAKVEMQPASQQGVGRVRHEDAVSVGSRRHVLANLHPIFPKKVEPPRPHWRHLHDVHGNWRAGVGECWQCCQHGEQLSRHVVEGPKVPGTRELEDGGSVASARWWLRAVDGEAAVSLTAGEARKGWLEARRVAPQAGHLRGKRPTNVEDVGIGWKWMK
mmetsp:Transcript_39/g.124  ORF Transcript_39/g.124 Transcript_39/m.124 type:complete len:270 (+) Transcript_39:407-1216(+)